METKIQIMKNADIITFADELGKNLEAMIDEEPQKVYVFANVLSKALESAQKKAKDGFVRFYESQGEVPGFDVRETNRTTYDFSTDEQWAELSARLKAREEELKDATKADLEGKTLSDENGNRIEPVKASYSKAYALVRKK